MIVGPYNKVFIFEYKNVMKYCDIIKFLVKIFNNIEKIFYSN